MRNKLLFFTLPPSLFTLAAQAQQRPNIVYIMTDDLYISLDTVRTNAEGIRVAYEQELSRVIIHGVLHLCGINDKGPGEREIMEACENRALEILST